MINVRKILLLSALLISASSITAPTYATGDEGDVVQAPRTIHAKLPPQLTQNIIQEIRENGRFLTSTKEYVLQYSDERPDQLDKFESYLNSEPDSSFARSQHAYMSHTNVLQYLIQENGHFMELPRLTFKEQDRAFVPESVATTSMQVPLSGQSPLTDYRSIAGYLDS